MIFSYIHLQEEVMILGTLVLITMIVWKRKRLEWLYNLCCYMKYITVCHVAKASVQLFKPRHV